MEEKKNGRVLVVGGAGFIGSHLTDALIARGYRVEVIDNLSGGKKERVHSEAKLHVLDICNYDDILPVFDGVDIVFHLAALPRIQFSIDYPRESHHTNVNGTLNVFLAAKEKGVKKVIYSASSSAYGNQERLPYTEDMKPMPISPYGLHKYIGEHYARVFADVYGLPTVSLRYFNVYGPRLNTEGAYALVMGTFLEHKKKGLPLPVTGDGEQTRDFTHVRDVVRANILAAESDAVGQGEVINIGSGSPLTINQLAELFGGNIEYGPARIEGRHSKADYTKAQTLLGWEPTVAIEDGVAELLREWKI
ncbi:MAG: NAD-dependent epimerase/dehydratase family protein [bacterium]|nr:NAD-dependent epimerase/dehydratase family protein [bacterium]